MFNYNASSIALSLASLFCINISNIQPAASQLYGLAPINIKEYLENLVRAYPETIERLDGKYLLMRSGARFLVSDNKSKKSFEELLAKPDIDDMFYVPYPVDTALTQPGINSDPGRVRFEPLFDAMYGDCKKGKVISNLRTIAWLPKHGGGSVTITRINGVDKALEAVSRELDELPKNLIKYLKPTAGTYNCRLIAGTNNKSMHAYAAAIDINSDYSNYWRWGTGDKRQPIWQNKIPIEIVSIFGRHGFIWGGYWYHYDTMHFEYRPELLPSKSTG